MEEKYWLQEDEKEEKDYQLRPQLCGLSSFCLGRFNNEIFRIVKKKQRFSICL